MIITNAFPYWNWHYHLEMRKDFIGYFQKFLRIWKMNSTSSTKFSETINSWLNISLKVFSQVVLNWFILHKKKV